MGTTRRIIPIPLAESWDLHFGRVGSQIVEELVAAHQPFVVIDEQESTLRTCSQRGYLALLGDATSDALLYQAGIGQAKSLFEKVRQQPIDGPSSES